MDLRYDEAYERFRGEVRDFLAAQWPPARGGERPGPEGVARFRERAIEAGYLARAVPRRYGGSEQAPDALAAAIIREEFRRARAPGDVRGIGPAMLVPTLLEKGEEWQKQKFVPPTLRGEVVWCQGYSEPDSGSDLASLQTRAERVGDEWVVNGQKIWTSGAHRADYMFCLCRTEPDAPKHAGISYLLIDMKQPGIEVRPLRQMTGESSFNQVFLNDVRTPADWIVGRRGEGWLVSRATLKHERDSIGNAEQSVVLFERLVELATRAGPDGVPASRDPAVRQRLAALEGHVRAHQYSGYVQLTRSARGARAGILQLMNKLVGTSLAQEMGKLAYDLLGESALLEPRGAVGRPGQEPAPEAAERGWVGQYMASLGGAIAGGTANIQRNIIAERGLGLPRDAAAQRTGS